MKTYISSFVSTIIVLGYTALTMCNAQSSENIRWARDIIGERAVPSNGLQVDVSVIGESGTVTAELMVANLRSGEYKPIDKVIAGRWDKQTFWPMVTLQVGDQFKGPWYTIARQSAGGKEQVIVVKPGQILTDWKVKLDRFEGYVGKRRVGRIVLSSGDSAVFELTDLIPPK